MAVELDGPRLAPRSGSARQLVVFLHGYGADGNDLIELGRVWQQLLPDAAFVSPHAPEPCAQAPVGRQWFGLTFRDPNERWVGVNKAAPVSTLHRRRAQAPECAAGGAGAGRIQPGHHDGAACRLAPGGVAGGDRRLFGLAGPAAGRQSGKRNSPRSNLGRRCCWCMAIRTNLFRPRHCLRPHRGSPPSACRRNGICPPASATASIPRVFATAANSWRAASPRSAEARHNTHNPRTGFQSCHACL